MHSFIQFYKHFFVCNPTTAYFSHGHMLSKIAVTVLVILEERVLGFKIAADICMSFTVACQLF